MRSNVLLVALCAAVLASCGSGDGSASDQTVLDLTSTNYVTVTQTPTTLTPTTVAGAAGTPGLVHPEEGSYVIASGDLPSTISQRFKVKFEDLLAINGWTLVGSGNSAQVPEYPGVGTSIKIPPGWTEPGTAAETTNGTTPSGGTTTTVAGGQPTCAGGEYTIVEGDYLGRVATKLDTTVEALNAANTNTAGYSAFYVGLKIKTPPKTNC